MTVAKLWQRGQTGWPRRFPVAQFPNPPLLIAVAGLGLADASSGTSNDVGRSIFALALGVWAWEETADGANWFRRLLGAGALVWLVASLAGELKLQG